MDIIAGFIFVAVIVAGIVFIAKRFLKPVKGPLPDCCGIKSDKNLNNQK